MSDRILVVDDEPEMLQVMNRMLTSKGYKVHGAINGESALTALEETMFDLVLCDLAMPPGMSGLELLERVRMTDSSLPFIIITGVGTIETAVQAIQLGAFHYITKPFKRREIEILTQRALEYGKLSRKINSIRFQDEETEQPQLVIGSSRCVIDLLRRVEKVSDCQATVLIQGETGTGKSLLAKIIHEKSSRRGRPFITVDCGAMPETLLESELFGHVKGAFTGAISAKRGLLEEAQGGTVFLDEIGEISLQTQVKLLRAVQEKEIRAVGGNRGIQIDVRFISATSKKLVDEVSQGRFREELYYRLAVVPLYLPPLRERLDDLPHLIDFLLKKFCRIYRKKVTHIKPEILQKFYSMSWKGNIRELANILERGVLLAEGDCLTPDCICSDFYSSAGSDEPAVEKPVTLRTVVEDAEKRAILLALKNTKNNRSEAARLLDISRRALYDKIEAYGITMH
jgi:DNA-binding NtrC family response regulator